MSPKTAKRPRAFQCGLSLVELMVALVIGLVLLAGLTRVYVSAKQSYNAQEQLARMQESGRFAMDLLTRDLRRSGYWGGNVDTLSVVGDPGPAIPAHACDLSTPNPWGRMIRWRVSGLNDTNAGYVDCTPEYLRGDILTVRYADSITIEPGDAAWSDDALYLRTTMFGSRLMTGALRGEGANQMPPDPTFSPTHLAPVIRRIFTHAYYIGDSGRTCGADPVPSLFRVRLGDDGIPVEDEVAPGVEQFQVRYLVRGAYRDSADLTNVDWLDIQAVRVWLLIRGECREPGLINDATYTMGDQQPFEPVGNNFRRQLYVSTVMLRNTVVQ